MPFVIQFRRDTAANWTSANPTLADGEMGIESDTQKYKIGNGYTVWNSLSYSSLPATAVSPSGTATLTNKTIDLTDNTVTGTLAEFNAAVSDADLVSLDGTESLYNKTIINSLVRSLEEAWAYSSQSINGEETINTTTTTAVYNYATATGNFELNVRGDASTTLNSLLNVNSSITVAWAVTNGAIGRYLTAFTVDGVAQTVKWQGGAAPTSGNANSVDVYVFTILKTAATPTYVVLGSLTQFA